MKHSLLEIVKDNTAKFTHFCDDKLYYEITLPDGAYSFPVDISDKNDIGNAVFNKEEKALLLMRYIRKAEKNEELRFIPRQD